MALARPKMENESDIIRLCEGVFLALTCWPSADNEYIILHDLSFLLFFALGLAEKSLLNWCYASRLIP